jgi:hypothetical protein
MLYIFAPTGSPELNSIELMYSHFKRIEKKKGLEEIVHNNKRDFRKIVEESILSKAINAP